MAKYFSTKYEIISDLKIQGETNSKEKPYISYVNIFLIVTILSFVKTKYNNQVIEKVIENKIKTEYRNIVQYAEAKLDQGTELTNKIIDKSIKEAAKNSTVNLQIIQTMNESEVSLLLLDLFEELNAQGETDIYMDVRRNSFGVVTSIQIKGIKYKDSFGYIKSKIGSKINIE